MINLIKLSIVSKSTSFLHHIDWGPAMMKFFPPGIGSTAQSPITHVEIQHCWAACQTDRRNAKNAGITFRFWEGQQRELLQRMSLWDTLFGKWYSVVRLTWPCSLIYHWLLVWLEEQGSSQYRQTMLEILDLDIPTGIKPSSISQPQHLQDLKNLTVCLTHDRSL